MSVERASYSLTTMLAPEDIEGFDKDYFIFRLRKEVAEARHHLDEDGNSTGADVEWRDIVEDLKPFSLKHPKVLMKIVASVTDGDTYQFHTYVRDGKSATIEPVLTWPEFTTKMLA